MALAAPFPTGTVTLLFTDIEGSTQRWEEQPEAMSVALRQHDELLRSAIEAHNGRVFKTMGDAFYAAFGSPSDAVAATLDAQRALVAQDWSAIGGLSVRMALHSGATDQRDGDYFGRTVNRVARLLAAAHGGQVVISNATAQLLHGLAQALDLRDLGEHRLKDLVEPEHVWQVSAAGLPDTFPPLLSLGSFPNNLPRQLTPLVGREEVLAEIAALVRESPLVTLVGTGGVGKTRVALQVGADLLDGSGDGVWFVELAQVSEASVVAGTVAWTLRVREQPGRPVLETLLHYLKRKRLLLILDNSEHLIEEVAKIADAILRECADVRVLTTSREPLRVTGERVYRMPSLGLPPDGLEVGAEDAPQYGAIALFSQRAQAADSRFQLTSENAPIVAEICRRLDGIALAIELAAARVRVLSPMQLAQKLDERFRVLTGGSRAALPRHQTMRALIDWSYDLLSEQEQKLFRRMGIFSGGWSLEAAETVASDASLDRLDVLDLLSSLSDKSLVVAGLEGSNARYRLLESIRAFALDKMTPDEQSQLARRHAEWAADLADRIREIRGRMPTQARTRAFESDLDNVRSAIQWALAAGEVPLAARIALGFTTIWRVNRGDAEPRRWLEATIPRLDDRAEPAIAAHALRTLASVSQGNHKLEAAQRALELDSARQDPKDIVASLYQMSWALRHAGRIEEAEAANDRALRLCKENDMTVTPWYATALVMRASIANARGRIDEARQLYAETLQVRAALGDEIEAITVHLNLGELEFSVGNYEAALECADRAAAEARRLHSKRAEIIARVNAAAYHLVSGNVDSARIAARETLLLARGTMPMDAAIAIQHLATIAAVRGDSRYAARLCGYVDAWYRSERYEREVAEQRTYEILTNALRESLGDAEIAALAAAGAELSEDEAATEALAV